MTITASTPTTCAPAAPAATGATGAPMPDHRAAGQVCLLLDTADPTAASVHTTEHSAISQARELLLARADALGRREPHTAPAAARALSLTLACVPELPHVYRLLADREPTTLTVHHLTVHDPAAAPARGVTVYGVDYDPYEITRANFLTRHAAKAYAEAEWRAYNTDDGEPAERDGALLELEWDRLGDAEYLSYRIPGDDQWHDSGLAVRPYPVHATVPAPDPEAEFDGGRAPARFRAPLPVSERRTVSEEIERLAALLGTSLDTGRILAHAAAGAPTATVLEQVALAHRRQDAARQQDHPDGTGPHPHTPAPACPHGAAQPTWRHLLTAACAEAMRHADPDLLRTQLLGVAVLAVTWIEAIDRRRTHAACPSSVPVSGLEG